MTAQQAMLVRKIKAFPQAANGVWAADQPTSAETLKVQQVATAARTDFFVPNVRIFPVKRRNPKIPA
jgi:hypothetical protein